MYKRQTKANADASGRIINTMIDEYVGKKENAIAFESLGVKRYLSSLKYATMVIGNSSSGLAEVPSFKIPTINIGDRQKGRLQAKSVINCEPIYAQVCDAIKKARSPEFIESINNVQNPYGDGNTCKKIVDILEMQLQNGSVNLKKKFYDIDYNI